MNKLHTALATVTAIIMLSACDPVTAPPTVSSDEFEGFTVHRVIPDNPIGIVYLFHGSGGSAQFGLKIETLDQTNQLLARGYGWVATESTQRDGNKRWDVNNPVITTNPDLARLARLHAHLISTTPIDEDTPIFGIGMSNGARMVTLFGQVFADNGYPVLAVAPYMGTAAPWVKLTGGLRIPGIWVNAINDATVAPGAVAADQAASAALGVPSVLFTKLEEPLLPVRFTRIPAINLDEAEQIYLSLAGSGVWDADGNRQVALDTAIVTILATPVPPGTGATPAQVRNQVSAMLGLHQFTAAFAPFVADFFDAQRLAYQL